MTYFDELPIGAKFEKVEPQIKGAILVKTSGHCYAFLQDSGKPYLPSTFQAKDNMRVVAL